jgi:hypothetical protein
MKNMATPKDSMIIEIYLARPDFYYVDNASLVSGRSCLLPWIITNPNLAADNWYSEDILSQL